MILNIVQMSDKSQSYLLSAIMGLTNENKNIYNFY